MNIAIVDDEKVELNAAESYIKEYLRENWSDIENDVRIQTFTCAKDFFDAFEDIFGAFFMSILEILFGLF